MNSKVGLFARSSWNIRKVSSDQKISRLVTFHPKLPVWLNLCASVKYISLCISAAERLAAEGTPTRVVSMPSWDLFERQDAAYRESVLPDAIEARVAVEQASTFGWERYVGDAGRVIGMKTFGASAPLKELQRRFGFEPDQVVAVVKEVLGRT